MCSVQRQWWLGMYYFVSSRLFLCSLSSLHWRLKTILSFPLVKIEEGMHHYGLVLPVPKWPTIPKYRLWPSNDVSGRIMLSSSEWWYYCNDEVSYDTDRDADIHCPWGGACETGWEEFTLEATASNNRIPRTLAMLFECHALHRTNDLHFLGQQTLRWRKFWLECIEFDRAVQIVNSHLPMSLQPFRGQT